MTAPTANGITQNGESSSAHLIIPSTQPEDPTFPGPFEGPEKLLEVWFAPSPYSLPTPSVTTSSKTRVPSEFGTPWRGLRKVPREVWEEMLDIVKCKVLSLVEGEELDAYLLSESSLFVAPHVLILKTCGTTLNLLGLHRIIEIAREYCGFTNVWRCFYSRKSFFFPERQSGPHKDWRDEVNFLDGMFGTAGSAYTVGPMNRDHWLLYLTSPNTQPLLPSDQSPPRSLIAPPPAPPAPPVRYQDTTLEILMSHLSPTGRAPFFEPTPPGSTGHDTGRLISTQLGIDNLFPGETTLDSYGFDPCGYSANGVIGSGGPSKDANAKGGGYFTIHVTPEEGWSYASFECNVPLPTTGCASAGGSGRPDLPTLIKNVVNIFQPNRLTITLFVSTQGGEDGEGEQTLGALEVETQAWKAFKLDLLGKQFERKDRIGYEFDGYDLVFALFERKGWREEKRLVADQ